MPECYKLISFEIGKFVKTENFLICQVMMFQSLGTTYVKTAQLCASK